jgi:hypothetical protein
MSEIVELKSGQGGIKAQTIRGGKPDQVFSLDEGCFAIRAEARPTLSEPLVPIPLSHEHDASFLDWFDVAEHGVVAIFNAEAAMVQDPDVVLKQLDRQYGEVDKKYDRAADIAQESVTAGQLLKELHAIDRRRQELRTAIVKLKKDS